MKKKKLWTVIAISLLSTPMLSPMIGYADSTQEETQSSSEETTTNTHSKADVASSEAATDSSTLNINLVMDTITLNVGDVFNPAEYATATKGSETIPYDENGSFVAIINSVDTTTAGTYQVVYRVHNSDGTTVDKTLTVIVKEITVEPSIEVSDKTMYVGDKLTEEDILGWANFKNTEELIAGFEVLGEAIPVYKEDSTLAEAGVYKIKYYVEGENGKVVVEKEMTLTVLAAQESTMETTSSNDAEGSNVLNTIDSSERAETAPKMNGETKPIGNGEKTLPHTGEKDSPLLIELGAMALLIGAYVLNKKRIGVK